MLPSLLYATERLLLDRVLLRCVKRRLADVVYRQLLHDARSELAGPS